MGAIHYFNMLHIPVQTPGKHKNFIIYNLTELSTLNIMSHNFKIYYCGQCRVSVTKHILRSKSDKICHIKLSNY